MAIFRWLAGGFFFIAGIAMLATKQFIPGLLWMLMSIFTIPILDTKVKLSWKIKSLVVFSSFILLVITTNTQPTQINKSLVKPIEKKGVTTEQVNITTTSPTTVIIEEPTDVPNVVVEPSATIPQPTITKNENKRGVINTIDKDPNSDLYQKIALIEVNIWENYGPNRGKVVGTLSHSTIVDVLDEYNTDQKYYKIRATGGTPTGWVSEQVLSLDTSDPAIKDAVLSHDALYIAKSSAIGKTYNMGLYLEQPPTNSDAYFMTLDDENAFDNILILCMMGSSDLAKLDANSSLNGIYKQYKVEVKFDKFDKALTHYSGTCRLK